MIEDAFTQSEYAIYFTDHQGILQKVNEAYLRLYKVSGESMVLGQTQRWIRSPFTPDAVYKDLWNTISSGQVWRGEMRNQALDGSEVFIHLTITPIRSEGQIVGYMGFAINRAQQVEMERQLLHANKMVVLGTLGAGLAHELNNPLASILLDAQYLRESLALIPDSGRRKHAMAAADSLIGNSERMRMVLEHLRIYSTKDSQETPGRLPLGSLLADSMLFVERQMRSRGIDLRIVAQDGIIIFGDRTQLESVILNLISNSRDAFAHRKGPGKRIRIEANLRKGHDHAIIEYRDNAGGIPVAIKERIFEPNFTSPCGVGTGLGLSISRQVIAQHNGTITCDSAGRETTFRITLPASLDCADKSASMDKWSMEEA